MKIRLGLLAFALAAVPALGYELVKDINTVPVNTGFVFPDSYRTADVANGTLFRLYEETHGGELWIGDGTVAGTHLVRDIKPGAESPDIAQLTAVSGVGYFFANDGVNGRELWRSDGTTAGTRMVANIGDAATDGPLVTDDTQPLAVINGILIFAAHDAAHGTELWRSDGTNDGTLRLTDAMAGATDGLTDAWSPVVVGTRVFFLAVDAGGQELWVTDGSAAGTHRVADIAPGAGSSNIVEMTAAGGALFFRANDGTHGNEIWRASGDGLAAVMIADLNTAGASNPAGLAPLGDGVMFVATITGQGGAPQTRLLRVSATNNTVTDLAAAPAEGTLRHAISLPAGALFAFAPTSSDEGTRVWISDGTAANTHELAAGLDFLGFSHEVVYAGGEAFFFARTSIDPHFDMWRTDGTVAGTRLYFATDVQNLSTPLVRAGGRFYYVNGVDGQQGGTGPELWVSDGTPTGTHLVRDIVPGVYGSSPNYLTRLANGVAFSADWTLWVSDGTTNGTVPMLNPGGPAVTGSSNPTPLGKMGNRVLYAAYDGINDGLWISDGTSAGTTRLAYVMPASGSFLSLENGSALFATGSGVSATLWRTDGTAAGTQSVLTFSNGGPISLRNGAVLNGYAYFTVFGSLGDEIWRSDGTVAGTTQIVPPGGMPSNALGILKAVAGNRVMFTAHMTTHMDLWWTDGTSAGTVKASDTLDVFPGYWSVRFQNRACFAARESGAAGDELWCTDGTDGNFVRITNLGALNMQVGFRPVVLGNKLLVDGLGIGALANGLFVTDGTAASTQMISAHRMDVPDGDPLMLGSDKLVFYSGSELWLTDGTSAGTRKLLPDGSPVGENNMSDVATFAGRVVFTLRDSVQHYSVWQSDGTVTGTKPLVDTNPGHNPFTFVTPGRYEALGSKLLFTSEGPTQGFELWSLSDTDPNASGDRASTNNNTAVAVSVLDNDSDFDSALSASTVAVVTAPASGTTAINTSTGAITYTPNNGFSGTDSFTYRVSDPQGHVSNTATVVVIVKPAAVTTAPGPAPTPTPTPTPTPGGGGPSGGGGGGGGALGVDLAPWVFAALLAIYLRRRRGAARMG